MNILLVKSSVRDGRTADKIETLVQEVLADEKDIKVEVADFKTNPLPFLDSPVNPANENFAPENENVINWTKQVDRADAVILLTAEYNHSYTAVLKNAIDWIYKEWIDKPVAFVGYGWVGGARAINHLRDVFKSNVSADTLETEANLAFNKQIELDGTPLNNEAKEAIKEVVLALKNKLENPTPNKD